MHPTIIKELIALTLLVIFIVLFYLSMPPMVYAVGYAAVVAMFAVFVVSLLTKTDRDEREAAHKSVAAEAGFVTAGVVLLVAIAHQTFVMQSRRWMVVCSSGEYVGGATVRALVFRQKELSKKREKGSRN